MLNKIIKAGIFLSLAFIGVSASIPSSASFNNLAQQNGDDAKNSVIDKQKEITDGDELIWENQTREPPGWDGNKYRFAYEGKAAEASYFLPVDTWERMKNETFYLDVERISGGPEIWICTGWWDAWWPTSGSGGQGYNNFIDSIDIEDGIRYRLEINLKDSNLASLMDDHDFSILGNDGFIPLRMYFPGYKVLWDNDNTFGDPSWSGSYRFGSVNSPSSQYCITLFSEEEWDIIKTKTIYLDLKVIDSQDYPLVIGVADAWWQKFYTDDYIYSGSPYLTSIGDKIYTLKIDLTDWQGVVELLDSHDLMFTGQAYIPLKLYYGTKPSRRSWENPYPDQVGGNRYYRFSDNQHTTGEEILAFSPHIWNKIKSGTFYLDLEAEENFEIRVTTGWWDYTWPNNSLIYPSDSHLTNKGDGKWTLTVNFAEDPTILNYLDEHHLLFTGANYRPVKIYFDDSVDPHFNSASPHFISNIKRQSASFVNDAYLTTKDVATRGETVTIKVNREKEFDFTQDDLKVTYNGTDVCPLTKVDDDTYTFVMPDYDVNITAFFDTDYQVNFAMEGYGKQIEPQTVHNGSTVEKPQDPTQVGQAFLGWYKENTYNNLWDFANDKVKGNTYLFAKWEEDPVLSIEMKSNPTKTIYKYGEDLDLTGAQFTARMTSGGSADADITPNMVSGYDKNKLGEQTLTVTYESFTTTFKVNVIDYISNIVIKSNPTKVEYKFGEDLDLTGAKIAINMASGATSDIDVTSSMVSGYDKNKVGEQTITVTYESLTTTFKVNVVDYAISIVIKSNPTKVEYKYGEDLDLNGAKLTVNMASGAINDVDVTSSMVSGYDKNKLGEQVITITYEGQTVTFTVTVLPKPVPKEIYVAVGGAFALIVLILAVGYFINKNKELNMLYALLPNNVKCVKTQPLDDRFDEYVFTYFYKNYEMSYFMHKLKTLHFSEAQAKDEFKQLIKNGKIRKYSNKYYKDIKKHIR